MNVDDDDTTVPEDDQLPEGADEVADEVPDALDPADDGDGGDPPEPQTVSLDDAQEG